MLLDSKLTLYNKVSTKATNLLIYCFRSCRRLQFNEILRNKRIDIKSAYYVVGTKIITVDTIATRTVGEADHDYLLHTLRSTPRLYIVTLLI